MIRSIKAKTILLLIIVLSAIFLGVGIFLDRELNSIIFESIDDSLHTKVQIVNSLIEHKREDIDMEFVEISIGEYSVPYSGHYYQVLLGDGSPFWRSPSLAEGALPYMKERFTEGVDSFYSDVEGPKGEPVRLLTSRLTIGKWEFVILAGDDISGAQELASSFHNVLLFSVPVAVILAIVGAMFIVVLSLRSVKHLSNEVEEITEKNLDKILSVDKMDSELVGLAEAFNSTFKRLDEAFLLQRKFLSDASHELRTPVSIIKSYCDITLKKERSADEYRETIEVVDETVARMSALVEKILDVARLESEGMALKSESLDLTRVVKSVYKLISPVAGEKGIAMTLNGAEKSMELIGDGDSLSELFMNLIDNGVKYNRKGGTVEITCTESNDWIEVSVADTGVGIPKEDLGKIFNRFYRVDTSRGEISGAGLGLNIVKAIAEAHGGRLDVESEYGKGSRFTVYLPKNGSSD
ncbi:MAG: hypothetical protein GY721_04660 [Deltaproteobacteria bacterium]|nr:hypothetical protein [Deltaproteobacteria bacterium]